MEDGLSEAITGCAVAATVLMCSQMLLSRTHMKSYMTSDCWKMQVLSLWRGKAYECNARSAHSRPACTNVARRQFQKLKVTHTIVNSSAAEHMAVCMKMLTPAPSAASHSSLSLETHPARSDSS
jgi:hypothetical protein